MGETLDSCTCSDGGTGKVCSMARPQTGSRSKGCTCRHDKQTVVSQRECSPRVRRKAKEAAKVRNVTTEENVRSACSVVR